MSLQCHRLAHSIARTASLPLAPPSHPCVRLATRLNYVHWVEDLLRSRVPEAHGTTRQPPLGLDLGTGASAIYALLGTKIYGWDMVATEIEPTSASWAAALVAANGLRRKIDVRQVATGTFLERAVASQAAGGWKRPVPEPDVGLDMPLVTAAPAVEPAFDPPFDFCMCNPPFFETLDEACANRRTANTGNMSELVYPGARRVRRSSVRAVA